MQEEQPVKPANILNIVATNQGKRPLTRQTPTARPLSAAEVDALLAAGHVVVDTRSSAEYGSGHIPGAFNVHRSSLEFEQRVGWVTPADAPIILVTNTAAEAQQCAFNMAFIALDTRVAGFLDGGMDAWIEAGRHVAVVPQLDVVTLRHRLATNGLQVLDVREQDEWDEGHIRDAHFMPYTSLVPQLDIPAQIDRLALTPDQPIAVTCATGKRSSTAISILRRGGFQHLVNVIGGMAAWENAGHEMVDAAGNVCRS